MRLILMRGLLALLLGLAAALIYQRAKAATAPDAAGSASPSGAVTDMGASQNLTAFLKLVRVAESGDDYGALVGGGNIVDFSDHPANKGWPGIRTPESRKSTAAGAYQITQTTWNTEVQNALRLPDFSPKSQDEAALWIIQFKRPGAWGLVVEGKLQAALMRLRDEWEAFDKMLAGTYPITLAEAQAIYTDAGGTVA
jgi:lysozyme